MIATAIAPIEAVAANDAALTPSRGRSGVPDRSACTPRTRLPTLALHHSHSAITPAIGARFGRIRIAIAAASPPAAADTGVAPSTHAVATAHAPAAGTSLIGAMTMNSSAGLVATIHAAASATAGRPSCRPIMYVAKTNTPPQMGTTQNIAHWPPISIAPAIR